MIDFIRKVVYKAGFRPKTNSVLYDQSEVLRRSYLDALKKIAYPVVIDMTDRGTWNAIARTVEESTYTGLDATPQSLYMALNFCPMCGGPLVAMVIDVKECPFGHGIAQTFDGPAGLPAILFEPSTKENNVVEYRKPAERSSKP